MNKSFFIYAAIAVILAAPACAHAKMVDFLGVTTDGTNAQIKAKLNIGDRQLTGVRSLSYNMTDGYTVAGNGFSLVEDGNDKYVSADVVYYPDADGYTYRLVLSFADGSTYSSEVVNLDLSESFYWLGDFPWTSYATGWDGHVPVIDGEVDPSLKMTLDGTVYYKGVSNHGDGHLEYDFSKIPEAPEFDRFYTKYGVQDDRPDGDIYFSFITDGTPILNRDLMFSKTNADRGNNPCVKDIEFSMKGVSVLRINEQLRDNNWGAHAHLAMARLYLPATASKKKQEQSVTFANADSHLSGNLQLNASSTSGGKVYYHIISGNNLAVIEGDVIRPLWGAKGRVVVEATQFGDDDYYPATSYLYLDVDMAPRMELLGLYTPSVSGSDVTSRAYLLVDTKGKPLDKLTATIYDNPRTLKSIGTVNLLPQASALTGAGVVEIPIADYADQVVRVTYSYTDSDQEIVLPYWHAEGTYDYVSDLPTSAYTYSMGYGAFPGPNHPYSQMNGDVMEIGTYNVSHGTYAKGFGIHAPGYINVLPQALTPYNRFVTEIGPQKNGTANYSNQKLSYQLTNGNMVLADSANMVKTLYLHWDFPINNQQALKIIGNQGEDGNGNDYVCIGGARLYYSSGAKTPQVLSWQDARRVISNKATSVALDATTENGFPVFYYIVKGKEYASISDGNLYISSLPRGGAEIVVDAIQPGNDVWGSTPVASCVFSLTRGLEVQRDEVVELSGSDKFDELIIHADKGSSGQVTVKKGLLDVKTVTLVYKFIPGEWTHISFPADLDLDKISNLRSLGYVYNAYGARGYYLKELDTENYAQSDGLNGWISPATPLVSANKGYLMMVDKGETDAPVDVTFSIENSSVDLANVSRPLGLSLDFTDMQPGKHTVTVASANPDVVSNNLTVEVTYDPSDLSVVPVNHEKALENMRFVFVNGHKAIRLTLPDPSPAKVVFFNDKGNKVMKAVRYVAPNVIDLSDMPAGHYNMMVSYGNAVRNFEIDL